MAQVTSICKIISAVREKGKKRSKRAMVGVIVHCVEMISGLPTEEDMCHGVFQGHSNKVLTHAKCDDLLYSSINLGVLAKVNGKRAYLM